jgi:CheY-like chemotaxis protein
MPALDTIDVLLVEDSSSDAEMTIRALRRGSVVNELHWVKDGVEALEFVRCSGTYAHRRPVTEIKLVLLDLKMPRLDGIAVLREMKSDDRTRAIPVVMMTSSNQECDIIECGRLGANGYVTKPVQLAAFMDTVARIGSYWLQINQSASGVNAGVAPAGSGVSDVGLGDRRDRTGLRGRQTHVRTVESSPRFR